MVFLQYIPIHNIGTDRRWSLSAGTACESRHRGGGVVNAGEAALAAAAAAALLAAGVPAHEIGLSSPYRAQASDYFKVLYRNDEPYRNVALQREHSMYTSHLTAASCLLPTSSC